MVEEKKEEEKKAKEKEGRLDLGPLSVSVGGLFKGLEGLIDLAAKVAEKGGEIKKEGEIKGLGKDAKGVYGFSIKTLGGMPVIERFGNIKGTAKGPVVEEEREPMMDVFDEKDHLLIIAELPGVEESDVRLDVTEKNINLKAERGRRKYRKDIELPSSVIVTSVKSVFKNGILEIKIEKAVKT